MATRRSQRRGGEKLSQRLGDVEAQARHQFLADKRARLEAESADVQCRFNIFDLIPELRSKIYAYAMTDQPRDLMTFKLPTLAMVSKQVRAEALPVFFAACVFVTDAKAYYSRATSPDEDDTSPDEDDTSPDEDDTSPDEDDWAEPNTRPNPNECHRFFGRNDRDLQGWDYSEGSFHVSTKTRVLLHRLPKRDNFTPVFKNIDIRVVTGVQSKPHRIYANWTMALHVPTAPKPKPTISNTKVSFTFLRGHRTARRDTTESLDLATLEWPAQENMQSGGLALIRDHIIASIEDLASSRENFLGFSLDDLEPIAEAFRYWPRTPEQRRRRFILQFD